MKAVEFLKKIDGKIKILFHLDADGACSAALVLAMLKQNGKNAELSSVKVEKEEIGKILQDDFDDVVSIMRYAAKGGAAISPRVKIFDEDSTDV